MPASEMFIASPASIEPSIMRLRAAASEPSRTTAAYAAAQCTASRPTASPIGVRTRTTTGAIACASASAPVYIVGRGGRPCVSSGSTSAQSARFTGLAPETLWPSWYITQPPVTSLPVPAVVGTVTRRMRLASIGCGSPGQAKRRTGAPCWATIRAPFAVSSAEPPPTATTTSASAAARAAPAASTLAVVGSRAGISQVATGAIARSASRSAGMPATAGSSTTNGRASPAPARMPGSSPITPSPKRMRIGRWFQKGLSACMPVLRCARSSGRPPTP